MEEFLKIIYRNYANEMELQDDTCYEKELKNTLGMLEKYLSKDISEDAFVSLIEEVSDIKENFFVMGMMLAIDIMNKNYIPRF